MRASAVVVVVALVAVACGSTPKKRKRGGQRDETAAEYQRRKAEEAGELDSPSESGKWGGWKYQGDSDDCRFVHGRKCFTKRENACKAAKCKTECLVEGGGPAVVTCAKPKGKG